MKAIEAQLNKDKDRHLRALFADDTLRGKPVKPKAESIYFDYSKYRVTDKRRLINSQLPGYIGKTSRNIISIDSADLVPVMAYKALIRRYDKPK